MRHLDGVVSLIADGQTEAAERALRIVLENVGDDRGPAAVETLIFGAALARRLSPRAVETANLYLTNYDVPQIRLFNLLARHVPTVFLASEVANELLVRACAEQAHPILIDVGIGTGRQMVAVLEALAAHDRRPSAITIIGIEPAKSALDLAAAQIADVATKHGLAVQFIPILGTAESLSADEWNKLARESTGAIINASFALHHIADVDGKDARTRVLRCLRGLSPSLIVLSEPNSNHHEPAFAKRYANCRHHFSTAFRVIDAQPIDAADRDALKVCFFGREIADILGNTEDQRSERHELTSSWRTRLWEAGFVSLPAAALPSPAGRGSVDVVPTDGAVGLAFEGELMVSVLCAGPGAEAPTESFVGAPATRRWHGGSERELDVETYLAALIAIANADGVLHPHERSFIDRQASLLGIAPELLEHVGSLDTLLATRKMNEVTREATLRDVVTLALIDGQFHDRERAMTIAIGKQLGIAEPDLVAIEANVREYLPEALDAAAPWFRKAWFLAAK